MKRGIAVLVSVSALCGVAYFTASKWAIRHETITFYDASRDNRAVPVDIASTAAATAAIEKAVLIRAPTGSSERSYGARCGTAPFTVKTPAAHPGASAGAVVVVVEELV